MKFPYKRVLFAAVAVGLVVAGFSFIGIPQLSTVTGQEEISLQANSDWTAYNEYYEEAEIYGHTIDMETTGAKDPETEDVARLIFDGEQILLDDGETYSEDGIVISGVRPSGEWFTSSGTYLTVSYDVGIDVPDEKFSMRITDLQVEKTGPGARKVEYNVSVDNQWHGLNAGTVYAEVAGNRVELLSDGFLPKGETSFSVVDSFSDYNSSRFSVERDTNKTVRAVIEDPSIPDGEKRVFGAKGSKTPDFDLKDISTDLVDFEVSYRFCGENSSYVDGSCEIEEDLHLRGDTCFLPENYTLVTETFSSGNYDSGDVVPEASYFCTRHPAIVTNDGVQTDRVTSPYRGMVDGKGFTVPEGQTYTLFWVVNANDVDVNRVCEEGTLNKTSGDCVVKPSVVHKCSEGQWSPSQGSCVVSPDTKTICEQGRYNKDLGVCVFTPEVEERCPVGSSLGEEGQCYTQASVEKVCPSNVEDGSIRGGKCVTDAVTVARDSPLSSFRVFLFDLKNWIESGIEMYI